MNATLVQVLCSVAGLALIIALALFIRCQNNGDYAQMQLHAPLLAAPLGGLDRDSVAARCVPISVLFGVWFAMTTGVLLNGCVHVYICCCYIEQRGGARMQSVRCVWL